MVFICSETASLHGSNDCPLLYLHCEFKLNLLDAITSIQFNDNYNTHTHTTHRYMESIYSYIEVVVNFVITYVQVAETSYTRMCTTQNLLTVNRAFPGPTITVTRGDTAIVKVINNGEHPITIHW